MSVLAQGISVFSSCNKAGSVPCFTQYLTQHPNDYTALTWRGRAYSIIGENDKAKADFETAVRVTRPPRKYLAEAHLENIYGNGARGNQTGKGENRGITGATKALEISTTFTVAYLGSSQCDIVNGNDSRAQESFLKAKELNPSICPWEDFREFKNVVLQGRQHRGSHSERHRSSEPSGVSGRGGWGGSRGGGGNGSGGDDDDDDPDGSKMLKKIKKEAPEVKKYKGRIYYRSKCGRYWYTKDTAGHGEAFFKKYEDKRSTLEFVGSVDKNLRDMPRKHESAQAPTIRKSDMDTVNI
ncbi:uncharacterized protein LOC134271198 [Saccostrea cucullata]|uniref:uncharacterized protein LOC134271198 n=1 Tax=Saccostrea cuccullata TaxID=36930 RepID=UPI002ED66030